MSMSVDGFEDMPPDHIELELLRALDGAGVLHLRCPAEPLRLENPTTIVRGDRVTHLVYDVSR